jgi:hypothetical protein
MERAERPALPPVAIRGAVNGAAPAPYERRRSEARRRTDAADAHGPEGCMAPWIDPGIFAVARVGGPSHDVAWAWRPAGSDDECYALHRPGDSADGFLRPNANTVLGYRFVRITPSPSTEQAFRTRARELAAAANLDPDDLVFVKQTHTTDPDAQGTGPAFLGTGLQRVRTSDDDQDPVVAWALRRAAAVREDWAFSTDTSAPYPTPGPNHTDVTLWFFGAAAVSIGDFESIADTESGGAFDQRGWTTGTF